MSRATARWNIRHYMALSRMPHSLIDMATPALAAMLWLGAFPTLRVALLGALTSFAGYTAVYSLNDIVDRRTDKAKARAGCRDVEGYLDAIFVRHPLAYDLVDFRNAVFWMLGWTVVAGVGAALLNPMCLVILGIAFVLESLYCALCWITPLRILVSGVVKTLGAAAAVIAVDPSPGAAPFLLLIGWLFFWEIGGQNIPADWTDLEEDSRLRAKTVPVVAGDRWSSRLVFGSLVLAIVLHAVLSRVLGGAFLLPYVLTSLAVSVGLLLLPAARLLSTRTRDAVFQLFNRASYYPLALAVLTVLRLLPTYMLRLR